MKLNDNNRFDMDKFAENFLMEGVEKDTPVYKEYVSGARKIWELYSSRYEIRPRSIKNAHNGSNRGVEFWENGKHLIGISIGKTTTLYVHDEELLGQFHLEYNQDTRGQYRHTFNSFEECISAVKEVM